AAGSSFPFHHKKERAVLLAVLEELVARLARKGLEIAHGTGIGRQHANDLARGHVVERFLGAKHGQRAVQSPCVDLAIWLLHGGSVSRIGTAPTESTILPVLMFPSGACPARFRGRGDDPQERMRCSNAVVERSNSNGIATKRPPAAMTSGAPAVVAAL